MPFLSIENSKKFFEKLCNESILFAPTASFDDLCISRITPENIKEVELKRYRTIDTVKGMVFKVSEKVSDGLSTEPVTLLGIKNCDVRGLFIEDRVYTEGDFVDPFYSANREKITIISSDCTDARDTCFCSLVGISPYPESNFDLNLSHLGNGYLAQIGSDKGKELIEKNKGLFSEPDGEANLEQKENRNKMLQLLNSKNKDYQLKMDLSEIHKRNLENKIWKTLTKDCVECSACNFICPTCTCFLLLDQERDERYKVWDACLKAGYARMAGGVNPRGKLYQRLQNRYHCKFDYSFDRLGIYTCVGCGRCIDACAGKIDMRKIFTELEKQVPLTAKLE